MRKYLQVPGTLRAFRLSRWLAIPLPAACPTVDPQLPGRSEPMPEPRILSRMRSLEYCPDTTHINTLTEAAGGKKCAFDPTYIRGFRRYKP